MQKSHADHMMNLAIFMDTKSVSGDETLLKEVRTHLNGYLDSDVGMLMSFARAVNQFDEDGCGFFAQILGQKKHKMDIKKMGIFPVVHGTRALAFKAKISKTNTFERIARLSQMGLIEQQLSQDVSEVLAYLMNTRLKNGLLALKHNQELAPNYIDTENLSTLERDLLKDALQVVKRFKHHVSSQFNLHHA
ncbi:putative signal-transduction protein containing cAMP-binding and CBS domain [Moraxella catarrhalis]|uniref:putative nucleotidyltransferase substrate binding domain-containing protein n=1 Tax=Moraxella catarrhalis TaxID=480 RepID=UPI0007F479B1|nr:putative nucleotidyltransferase substrate binding domain-containing protein [Moraxella catarrhalis]OAV35235.1 putative signal-transduction protein containing cAMP-binding and CBS domain [Moraxella catarrhalis]